jgi:Fe-Mn family superoxide dismutase
MSHELPKLPYAVDALEPFIDAKTMEIHHGKHHNAYVTNLNAALQGKPGLERKSLHDLLSDLGSVPEDIRTTVRNNGGGHFNHSFFWPSMAPSGRGGGGEPKGELAEALNSTFGSFTKFKETLSTTAVKIFGSGWAWLSLDSSGKLVLKGYPNQDNPLLDHHTPILGLDVWEHAYYLKYQNRRPDYVTAWCNVVNWDYVTEQFIKAESQKLSVAQHTTR